MDMVEAVRSQLNEIEAELASVKQRRQELEVAKSVLEKVLECGGSSNGPTIRMPQEFPPQRFSTVDCIKRLLAQHPEGLPMKRLVDELEHQIISNASNKRRVLQNTILQLQHSNAIRKLSRNGEKIVKLKE